MGGRSAQDLTTFRHPGVPATPGVPIDDTITLQPLPAGSAYSLDWSAALASGPLGDVGGSVADNLHMDFTATFGSTAVPATGTRELGVLGSLLAVGGITSKRRRRARQAAR